MGIRGSKMTFLRPAYYRDLERKFRVFEASLLWGKTEDRTAGKQSERDRVRGPVFVASLLWGFGRVAEITIGRWAKVIM